MSPTVGCCICGQMLGVVRLWPAPVCARPRCRFQYSRLPPDSLCSECGVPLHEGERRARHCAQRSCTFSAARKLVEATRAAREKSRAELRETLAARRGLRDAQRYDIIAVPSQRAPLTRLSEGRKRDFRRQLEALVERVCAAPLQAPPLSDNAAKPLAASPAVAQVLGAACAQCKGHCCVGGGTHLAWLKAETIARYVDEHPGTTGPEIVAAYMSAIGSRSYRDSCIYHGRQGCTLPRALRSDTCNRFYCQPLKEFAAQATDAGPVRVFLVVRTSKGQDRGSFVESQA